MQCPKCSSFKTGKNPQEADEHFCLSCFNTFYDQRRVIRDVKTVAGAAFKLVGAKEKPVITGVEQIYKAGGLV